MKFSTPTDIASLARFILSPECKSIAILSGAGKSSIYVEALNRRQKMNHCLNYFTTRNNTGVSVASGIPDFRSPGGMYDTLRPDLITANKYERALMEQDPTYVVSWDIFKRNPFPYLEVRRPFILNTRDQVWKATIAHRFAELLHTKTNKLTRVYTQNIDGLDRQNENVPSDKIISVHGTIAKANCEGCGHEHDFDSFCNDVQIKIKDIYKMDPNAPTESSLILCQNCGKPLVKPSTVLYGRSLPSEFFEKVPEDLETLDLLIIAGTSLTVAPANQLVYSVPDETIRVVVDVNPVGQELGIDYSATPARDFFAQGPCDAVFLDLITELGWLDDLNTMKDLLPEASVELLEKKLQ